MGRQKTTPEAADAAGMIGDRIRTIRHNRGLTLKELGERTGLTHAFLSQVERGRARPSLSTLADIAAGLDVGMSVLVSRPADRTTVRVTRRDDAPVIFVGAAGSDAVVRAVSSEGNLMKATLSEGSFLPSALMAHPGEELLYVLAGRIAVELAGTRHELESGDTIVFDGTEPHRYETIGDVPPRLLMVVADLEAMRAPLGEDIYDLRRILVDRAAAGA